MIIERRISHAEIRRARKLKRWFTIETVLAIIVPKLG
jgi:hypothetical protein